MCGIFASNSNLETFGMLHAMHARGPDEKHILSAAGLHVGFARLAIVGTQNDDAQQPRRTSKGRICCFNGELYNYKALDSAAKSEIALLCDLLDWGADPRALIDGDYAICYFDPSNRQVTLYRDRWGVCPLYYQFKPYFAVASERKYLRNPREVFPHERVIFSLDRDCKRATIKSRDRFRHYGVTLLHHAQTDSFEHLLFEAVMSRARHSEVGFSVTCSGGLDSSTVVYALYALGLRPENMICVSWGATEDSRLASMVADSLHWPLLIEQVHVDTLRADARRIHDATDMRSLQGLQWRVAVRDYYVARAASAKVVLTGEGSDELFDGYPPHPERLKIPYRIAHKQISAINSLPKCSLELSNKVGLHWSKEFRAPFLHSLLSYYLLASQTGPRKQLLRNFLRRAGAPRELYERDKWGKNEQRLDSSLDLVSA